MAQFPRVQHITEAPKFPTPSRCYIATRRLMDVMDYIPVVGPWKSPKKAHVDSEQEDIG